MFERIVIWLVAELNGLNPPGTLLQVAIRLVRVANTVMLNGWQNAYNPWVKKSTRTDFD